MGYTHGLNHLKEPETHKHPRLSPHYRYCGESCVAFHALVIWPPEHKDRVLHLVHHSRRGHRGY